MDPMTSTKYDNEGYSTDKTMENCVNPSNMNIKPVIDNRYIHSINFLCQIRQWDIPKYDYIRKMVKGLCGDEALHTAICSTMTYKSIGYGRKKSVAKAEAAQKMYEQIFNLSKDEIDNILQQCKHIIPDKNFDNKKTLVFSTSPAVLKCVIEFLDRLHNSLCLKDIKELDSFENISAFAMLNTLASREKLSFTYFQSEIPGVVNMAEVNIIDGLRFVGIGLTSDQAAESAALSVLTYLKLMS
ncbi:unnamed protein product [Macrosiphum euphorbiae]|uniref:Uncharacterized protein n=1 Tax=Macrosiphum euphorbiae TaxID=13131 RepID=A0AAV0WQE9_9HEMI|nr:unnamed protein product [Macrosiphum euphorbiae]